MSRVINLLPELQGEEMIYIDNILQDLNDEQAVQFANVYRSRRRDPQVILLTTLLGFVVIAGVQRFLLNQIGMGLIYLFTGGLCLIGTIVDLVNYRKLSFEYNSQQAREIILMVSR
jgi:TM2 domain-containing membrane protein YozV